MLKPHLVLFSALFGYMIFLPVSNYIKAENAEFAKQQPEPIVVARTEYVRYMGYQIVP